MSAASLYHRRPLLAVSPSCVNPRPEHSSSTADGTNNRQIASSQAALHGLAVTNPLESRDPGSCPEQRRYGGHPCLSGEIPSARLDVDALGMVALRLEEMGMWVPRSMGRSVYASARGPWGPAWLTAF